MPIPSVRISHAEQVLDTHACAPLAKLLNEYENSFYPKDLQSDYRFIRHWIDSDFFFCSARIILDECGNYKPTAVISFLITSESSITELTAGKIRESQLTPWDPVQIESRPVVYYASFIRTDNRSVTPLFNNLRRDLLACQSHFKISQIAAVYSIAANAMGAAYLKKQGFTRSVFAYLEKYRVFKLSTPSKARGIWLDALQSKGN
ncbi:MAG: hypothetical protein J0M09_05670 [Xanthomonadales bacterium]|nr:hypothetical protein [Xanthomonadales bacterium]